MIAFDVYNEKVVENETIREKMYTKKNEEERLAKWKRVRLKLVVDLDKINNILIKVTNSGRFLSLFLPICPCPVIH